MVAMFIITKREDMEKLVFQRAGRGVTRWVGEGAYSSQETDILLTVVSKKEALSLRRALQERDPNVFAIICEDISWWGISRNGYRGGRRTWEESSGSFCSWDAACWPAVSRQRRFRCRRRWVLSSGGICAGPGGPGGGPLYLYRRGAQGISVTCTVRQAEPAGPFPPCSRKRAALVRPAGAEQAGQP